MAVVPIRRPLSTRITGRAYGFGRVRAPFMFSGFQGFGAIVTPGQSTYPSQDGTFTIVRGTGSHYGNGLIDGMIIGGGSVGGYYDLDDNNTGLGIDPSTLSRKYKVGSELQTFVDDTPTSPEYLAWEVQQRKDEEAANPLLAAYDDALRAWGTSQQPPVQVDPLFGFATNFAMDQAPLAVQKAYADFTHNPMPEPAPPAPGPAIYLQGGIAFGDDGTVYDPSTHQPIGVTLTPVEVNALKTTGALPPGDKGPTGLPGNQPAAPPPASATPTATSATPQSSAPTSSAPAAQTGGVTDGSQPASGAGAASTPPPATFDTPIGQTSQVMTQLLSSAAGADVPAGGGGGNGAAPVAAAAPSSGGMGLGVLLLLAVGVGGAALMAHTRPRR